MPQSDTDLSRPSETRAGHKAGEPEVIITCRDVTVRFGSKTILEGLSMDVRRGEILGFVGASGTGKSVLLRTILGLNAKQAGTIEVFGIDYERASDAERLSLIHI